MMEITKHQEAAQLVVDVVYSAPLSQSYLISNYDLGLALCQAPVVFSYISTSSISALMKLLNRDW